MSEFFNRRLNLSALVTFACVGLYCADSAALEPADAAVWGAMQEAAGVAESIGSARQIGRSTRDSADALTKTKSEPAKENAATPDEFEEVLAAENAMVSSGAPLEGHREVPNYDQRPSPGPSALEVAAWVPRVLFFPLYLVSEYVLRRPLEFATESFERWHLLERADAATSWDNDRAGILPRVRIQNAFAPAIGLTVFWNDMIFERNDWEVGADSDFDENLTVDFGTNIRLTPNANVGARYRLEQRNDFVYFGTGALTEAADETRFLRNKHLGIVEADYESEPMGVGVGGSVEISRSRFRCTSEDRDICGPDDIPNSSDDLLPIDEPGSATSFSDGYSLLRFKLATHWDSREARPASGSGARLDLFSRFGQGVGDDSSVRFVRYGAEGSLFWDFWKQRTLGLRVFSELATPLTDEPIPFAELITMGGIERMRGFYFARFHGESAIVATVDYRFPVSSFFDGNLFFETGNVFDEYLSDFDAGHLRPSVGLSLRTLDSRSQSFDITLALGGDRFEEGIAIEAARISIGTNLGY